MNHGNKDHEKYRPIVFSWSFLRFIISSRGGLFSLVSPAYTFLSFTSTIIRKKWKRKRKVCLGWREGTLGRMDLWFLMEKIIGSEAQFYFTSNLFRVD